MPDTTPIQRQRRRTGAQQPKASLQLIQRRQTGHQPRRCARVLCHHKQSPFSGEATPPPPERETGWRTLPHQRTGTPCTTCTLKPRPAAGNQVAHRDQPGSGTPRPDRSPGQPPAPPGSCHATPPPACARRSTTRGQPAGIGPHHAARPCTPAPNLAGGALPPVPGVATRPADGVQPAPTTESRSCARRSAFPSRHHHIRPRQRQHSMGNRRAPIVCMGGELRVMDWVVTVSSVQALFWPVPTRAPRSLRGSMMAAAAHPCPRLSCQPIGLSGLGMHAFSRSALLNVVPSGHLCDTM